METSTHLIIGEDRDLLVHRHQPCRTVTLPSANQIPELHNKRALLGDRNLLAPLNQEGPLPDQVSRILPRHLASLCFYGSSSFWVSRWLERENSTWCLHRTRSARELAEQSSHARATRNLERQRVLQSEMRAVTFCLLATRGHLHGQG